MKNTFFLIIFLASATLLSSCLTQYERNNNKLIRAKRKIEKILTKYPELKTTTDTVILRYDTIIENRIVEYRDTIVTERVTMDSSFYYKLDSVYKVQQGSIEALFKFTKDNKFDFKVIKQPEVYYIHDTIRFSDTIINNTTTVHTKEIINTKDNIWYSIYSTIKNWIWLILLGIIVFLIIKLIIKK